jgi:hypothetical protein
MPARLATEQPATAASNKHSAKRICMLLTRAQCHTTHINETYREQLPDKSQLRTLLHPYCCSQRCFQLLLQDSHQVNSSSVMQHALTSLSPAALRALYALSYTARADAMPSPSFASNAPKLVHTLTCWVRCSSLSYSARARVLSPSAISKSM